MAKMIFSAHDFGYKSAVLGTTNQTIVTDNAELGETAETGDIEGMKSVVPHTSIMKAIIGIIAILFLINWLE